MSTPTPRPPVACEQCWTLDAVPADAAPLVLADDLHLGDYEPGFIPAGAALTVCEPCRAYLAARIERQR